MNGEVPNNNNMNRRVVNPRVWECSITELRELLCRAEALARFEEENGIPSDPFCRLPATTTVPKYFARKLWSASGRLKSLLDRNIVSGGGNPGQQARPVSVIRQQGGGHPARQARPMNALQEQGGHQQVRPINVLFQQQGGGHNAQQARPVSVIQQQGGHLTNSNQNLVIDLEEFDAEDQELPKNQENAAPEHPEVVSALTESNVPVVSGGNLPAPPESTVPVLPEGAVTVLQDGIVPHGTVSVLPEKDIPAHPEENIAQPDETVLEPLEETIKIEENVQETVEANPSTKPEAHGGPKHAIEQIYEGQPIQEAGLVRPQVFQPPNQNYVGGPLYRNPMARPPLEKSTAGPVRGVLPSQNAFLRGPAPTSASLPPPAGDLGSPVQIAYYGSHTSAASNYPPVFFVGNPMANHPVGHMVMMGNTVAPVQYRNF